MSSVGGFCIASVFWRCLQSVSSVLSSVRPVCVAMLPPLALMSSASKVRIGLTTLRAGTFVGVSLLLIGFVLHHDHQRLAFLSRLIRSGDRLAVFFSFRQASPDDPCGFVCHRDGREAERFFGKKSGGPDVCFFRLPSCHQRPGGLTDSQQFSDEAATLLGNPPETVSPATGFIERRLPQLSSPT